ncbi:MAG: hypothetical protein JNN15_14695 [Blastocatellia bacterium]|nr:hypothetical protein [Blastocatellia bacterium]
MSEDKFENRVDKIEKTVSFIIEQQAKFSVDIDLLKESQKKTDEEVKMLTKAVAELTATVAEMKETMTDMQVAIAEMKDAVLINNSMVEKLVNVVESDREFMKQVPQLAIASERRITKLEEKTQ